MILFSEFIKDFDKNSVKNSNENFDENSDENFGAITFRSEKKLINRSLTAMDPEEYLSEKSRILTRETRSLWNSLTTNSSKIQLTEKLKNTTKKLSLSILLLIFQLLYLQLFTLWSEKKLINRSLTARDPVEFFSAKSSIDISTASTSSKVGLAGAFELVRLAIEEKSP